MDDFTNLCSIVIDSKYSIKTLPMTYAVSIKLQIDEINSDRHLQMYFDEFIEAICRVLDKLSPIPLEDDPEDWSQTSRQDQHLSQKLVNIMPIFHKNLKDDHKMIRDKFVLPKKDEGGYYTFDLASQFYANYPKGLHK